MSDTPGRKHAIEVGASFSGREFRSALGRFASGVTVITTQHEGRVHGMTANAFVSVSLEPPLVLVSVDARAQMHRLLSMTRRCGVSILAENQEAVSDHFAGRLAEEPRIQLITRHNVPVLDGAVAHLIASIVEAYPAGDHTLYLGRVEYIDWNDGKPLLFYRGKYHQLSVQSVKPTPWLEDEFSLFSIGPFDPPDPLRRRT